MHTRWPCLVVVCLFWSAAGHSSDWPQFLGPMRNGVYAGSDVADHWLSDGPPVLWHQSIGHGFSGPVIADDKLILFHRLGDQETVESLDARTGAHLWTSAYPTSYQDDFGFDDGPRATPCINGGRVYTFGAQGNLQCLDLTKGTKLWSVDLQKEYQAGKGFFGMACSPLVEGNAVLLNIGGTQGAGIIAIDKLNGKLLWKSSDDEASYSSPVAATIEGRRYALFFTRNGLVAVDPDDGRIQFQSPWHSRNRTSVNAATPLVLGDTVFLSACYGTGACLLRLHGADLQQIWSGDDLLSNHYATSVERAGFLYGIHGRTDPGYNPPPKLRCVDIKAKRIAWETDAIRAASITLAGSRLLILTETGELVNAAATTESFQPANRARILHSETRAFPALANGLFYARDKEQLVCVDLRTPQKHVPESAAH